MTTPASWHAYAAAALERERNPRPWDHPYEGDSEWPDLCIHCGLVGSYAHTQEFYEKWVVGWR